MTTIYKIYVEVHPTTHNIHVRDMDGMNRWIESNAGPWEDLLRSNLRLDPTISLSKQVDDGTYRVITHITPIKVW